jgi:hypothetical protein
LTALARARELTMKPLWTQTLAWLAAALAAILLALATPDGVGVPFFDGSLVQGTTGRH